MPFIEIKKDGSILIDDSDIGEKYMIDSFMVLAEKRGFDHLKISSGVDPRPDFGYFALADRFWRASLCIYFAGVTNCFWERGKGFSEPWLFNARHAIELYIKGFILNTVWLSELQKNPTLSTRQTHNLLKKILRQQDVHQLFNLYIEYQKKIEDVIRNWNTTAIPEILEINGFRLSQSAQEILKELDKADNSSFRFRYPSLKQDNIDYVQIAGWDHEDEKLLPKTGLPIASGYFFDHIKVINGLHELISEIKSICDYFVSVTSFQDAKLGS